MKNHLKTLVFILPLFLSVNSFSQGDLQFNRTINYSNNFTSFGIVDSIIVPPGKVLKIISTSLLEGSSGAELDASAHTVTISNQVAFCHEVYGGIVKHENLPIWLGPGSHEIFILRRATSGALRFSFSGIEFNVVP